MTSADDFQRIERLFNAAIELPEADRQSFIESECPDDVDTQDRVHRMIDKALQHSAPGIGLPRPPGDFAVDEEPGAVIGRYTLLRRIGDGGMGVVFEAEQTEPVTRNVALKLIKLGMDTRHVLARFDSERQLLARMQHPNIAALYDAGATERGRPYFVMEFIDGTPITRFCEQEKLSLRERLVLFLQVCDAVQHAHQKGVIHRDLKPGNVQVALTGGSPVVKIIDFGIARIVGDSAAGTLATRVGQIVGTPDYMSPEQLASDGADVDTRADVYALGVLMHELLTGVLPSASGTSGLHAIGNDLEWIVLKALHEDRDRRYQSAFEFAADIRRHLDGRPVLAGPDSMRYRLGKFVRRNLPLVTATSAIAIALIAAVILSSRYALEAETERNEAQRQTRIATAVNDYLNQDLLAYADPKIDPDREVTLREIVDRSAESLGQRFAEEPLVEAMIRMTLGRTYQSLGDIPAAELHFRRALELRHEMLGEAAADTLESTVGLVGVLYEAAKYQEGLALLDPAIVIMDTTLPPDDPVRLYSINTLASLYDGLGRWDDALETYERAVRVHESILGRHHIETLTAINNLALTLAEEKRIEEAQALMIEVLDVRRRELGNEHPDTILSMGSVAFGHMQLADYVSAQPLLEEATDLGRRVLGPSHWWHANNLGLLGLVYLVNGMPERAEAVTIEAIDALEELLGSDHPIVVTLGSGMALVHGALGRHDDASATIDRVVAYYEQEYGADDARTFRILHRQSIVLQMAGRCDAARGVLASLPPDAIERLSNEAEGRGLRQYTAACNN